jgi:hypothetical protein
VVGEKVSTVATQRIGSDAEPEKAIGASEPSWQSRTLRMYSPSPACKGPVPDLRRELTDVSGAVSVEPRATDWANHSDGDRVETVKGCNEARQNVRANPRQRTPPLQWLYFALPCLMGRLI